LTMKIALEAVLEALPAPVQLDPAKEPSRRFGMVNRLLTAYLLFG
jgi:hypothetical protein